MKKRQSIWKKALIETSKHYFIMLILLLVYNFVLYRKVYFTWELVGFLIWFPLPLIIAIFISCLFIYSKLQPSKKNLFSILVYFFIGLFYPLFLLVGGAYAYFVLNNRDGAIALAVGLPALKLYLPLIIADYVLLFIRNKKQFRKKLKGGK